LPKGTDKCHVIHVTLHIIATYDLNLTQHNYLAVRSLEFKEA